MYINENLYFYIILFIFIIYYYLLIVVNIIIRVGGFESKGFGFNFNSEFHLLFDTLKNRLFILISSQRGQYTGECTVFYQSNIHRLADHYK